MFRISLVQGTHRGDSGRRRAPKLCGEPHGNGDVGWIGCDIGCVSNGLSYSVEAIGMELEDPLNQEEMEVGK
jgi:hypothetical protein